MMYVHNKCNKFAQTHIHFMLHIISVCVCMFSFCSYCGDVWCVIFFFVDVVEENVSPTIKLSRTFTILLLFEFGSCVCLFFSFFIWFILSLKEILNLVHFFFISYIMFGIIVEYIVPPPHHI